MLKKKLKHILAVKSPSACACLPSETHYTESTVASTGTLPRRTIFLHNLHGKFLVCVMILEHFDFILEQVPFSLRFPVLPL